MTTAEKAVKERDCTQMSVARKDQTTNAGRRRRKIRGCPNQASKQLTPNERNKTAETTSKPQTVAYLQASGGKKTQKTPPNHNSLIDYCLQQSTLQS